MTQPTTTMPAPIPAPPHNHRTAQIDITLDLPDDTEAQVSVYLFTDEILGLPEAQRWPGHCAAMGTVHVTGYGLASQNLHRLSYLPRVVRTVLAQAALPTDGLPEK